MHILTGALIGLVIGGIAAVVAAKVMGAPVTWQGVLAGCVGGAIGGAVTAATLGAGAPAGIAIGQAIWAFGVGGAAAGASSKLTENLLARRKATDGLLANTIGGAVGGALAGLTLGFAAPVVSRITGAVLGDTAPAIVRTVTQDTITGAASGAAGGAGGGAATQAVDNVANGRPIGTNVVAAAESGFVSGGAGGLVGGGVASGLGVSFVEPEPPSATRGIAPALDGDMGEPTVGRAAPGVKALAEQERAAIEQDNLNHVRPAMNDYQQSRVDSALGKLTADQRATFGSLLDHAGSGTEKEYLTEALVAGHDMKEIRAFALKIRGKPESWLNRNLTLVDSPNGVQGAKQVFADSCVPTAVVALRAEYDPVFALGIHEANPKLHVVDDENPFKHSPNFADLTGKLLVQPFGDDPGGGMSARSDGDHGDGRMTAGELGLLNAPDFQKASGLEWKAHNIQKPETAVQYLKQVLGQGYEALVDVGDKTGGHGTFVRQMRVKNGETEFQFYDPWEGVLVWRSEHAILNGHLRIAGWPGITTVYLPTPIAR